MATARNYKREYRKFHSSPTAKKNRALRNKARATAKKKWLVRKWDWKDVHHTNWIRSKKTRVISASKNRWIREKSRLKWSRRNTRKWWK